ncbi:MAG TPA: hypothetical protein VKS01_08030, partial [Bryobacteraceae bacterium]|nr:hypothetical protein [Bryobacteraceae bacterium]
PSSFAALPAVALVVALLLATAVIDKGWDAFPQGNWDAWSIWNLRAKFLATPALAARAWSPLLSNTHPEYPLLLSGAIARCWNAARATPEAIPMAIGYTFFLSLIAMVTGGLAMLRGAASGLIAGLTLACTTSLILEVPAQYADVPLAAYLAGAVIFLLLERPTWAGVLAGCAAWSKDEGAMFCALFLIFIAIFRRRHLPRALIGIAPLGVVYAGFKLFFAPHLSVMFGPGSLARFADAARWKIVLAGIATQMAALGAGWVHPALVLIALAIALRFRSDFRRDALLAGSLAIALLAVYSIAMVTAPNDAQWQASTAAARLIVQWWPLAVIAIAVWLRPAEQFAAAPQPRPARVKKARR